MDIKAVLRNIKVLGFKKTYRIYKKRKSLRQDEAGTKNLSLNNLSDENKKLKKEISSLRKDLSSFKKELSLIENLSLRRDLELRRTPEMTDGEFAKLRKSFYVKEIFPAIYREESKKSIENKVVFMERGMGVSASLKYMRSYIKNNTNYTIKTFSLEASGVSEQEYLENAKDYIRECATAKAIFICTANDLMGYFELRPETTYIQLWHGCGAFKKVGLSTIDKKFGKSAESHKEYPINTNYSYVTIASPEVAWIFEESMGIDKDSGIIVPTGISRTDEFFDKEFINTSYKKLYDIIPQAKGKKVILYAPTFRGEVATCVSPDVLDVKKFAEKFGDDYVLIFKHHQSVKVTPPIPEEYENKFAFDMTRGKGMSINELMTVADIMISDYSSVVFEYSLFERPMIFFTYDIDEYIDDRGLYYDFNEITPGPMFDNNDDIIDYIEHIEERFNKQEVTDFKNKFMCCCDGHSSERILKLIK